MAEVVVFMRVAWATVGVNQSCLSATSCTSCTLSIVGWSRRHIAHPNDGEVFDVDTQLHSRGAIKDWEFSFSEILLTLFTVFFWNLTCMVFCFQAYIFERYALVELLEIMVGFFVKYLTTLYGTESYKVTANVLLVASLPKYATIIQLIGAIIEYDIVWQSFE